MSENKYEIVALFGESGAGKDSIQRWIAKEYPNINTIVSCTTRPKRDYEKEGKDYYFLSNEEFATKVLDGTMLEATKFREWFYGTPLSSLSNDKLNVGVFNIQGINCLIQDPRLVIYPIHIYTSDKERLMRSLNREENPDCKEICRRFLADEDDFDNIEFDYQTYVNSDGKPFDTLFWDRYLGQE